MAATLRKGEGFEFVPDADLRALWREANLRGEGIDPKRSFGTDNVSHDVHVVIDPDKNLSNAPFSKRCKTLESNIMSMPLRFVQAAELPYVTYVTYVRNAQWQWDLAMNTPRLPGMTWNWLHDVRHVGPYELSLEAGPSDPAYIGHGGAIAIYA